MSQFGHPNFRTVHCLPSGMLRENEQTNKKKHNKKLDRRFLERGVFFHLS